LSPAEREKGGRDGIYRARDGQHESVAQTYRWISPTECYSGTHSWPNGAEKYSLTTHLKTS